MDFEPKDKSFEFDGQEKIDASQLDTFPYDYPYRDVDLTITTDEFTAVCPFSGLPDFGRVTITYAPGEVCIELRSLKYYLQSYRTVGIWYEHAVNRILEDLVRSTKPRRMEVHLDYNVRGGLKSLATARYDSTKDEMPETSPKSRDGKNA